MTVDVLRQNPLSANNSATPNLQPLTDLAIAVRHVSTLRVYPLYADPRDRLKQSLYYALPGFSGSSPASFRGLWFQSPELWNILCRSVASMVNNDRQPGIVGEKPDANLFPIR